MVEDGANRLLVSLNDLLAYDGPDRLRFNKYVSANITVSVTLHSRAHTNIKF